MTAVLDRHPWLAVPLVLLAFCVPQWIDELVRWWLQ